MACFKDDGANRCVLVLIVLLLIMVVILVPLSFSYVEYYQYGLVQVSNSDKSMYLFVF